MFALHSQHGTPTNFLIGHLELRRAPTIVAALITLSLSGIRYHMRFGCSKWSCPNTLLNLYTSMQNGHEHYYR